MKAIVRSLSVSALAVAAAGCSTPNPTALDRPGDVPAAFTAPVVKDAPIWPEAGWWVNFEAPELPALEDVASGCKFFGRLCSSPTIATGRANTKGSPHTSLVAV